jgi:hypothetical protein
MNAQFANACRERSYRYVLALHVEALVIETFGQPYDLAADMGLQMDDYIVVDATAPRLGRYAREDLESFKAGRKTEHMTHVLFNSMASLGIIDKAAYLIHVAFLVAPIKVVPE